MILKIIKIMIQMINKVMIKIMIRIKFLNKMINILTKKFKTLILINKLSPRKIKILSNNNNKINLKINKSKININNKI